MGEVADVRDGTHDSPKFYEYGHPLVTSKNLTESGLDMTNISFISIDDFKSINKRSRVDIGDIIFGMIGTIGNPVIIERDDFAIKNVALIKKGAAIPNDFLIQHLKSPVFESYIHVENAGNTQRFLSLSKIRDYILSIPTSKEMTAIGNFFRTLDNIILLYKRKAENLRMLKKACLQQLFPQEGERLPKVRFKGFTGDWKTHTLGEIGSTYTGLSGKTKEDFGKGEAKFVTYLNILNNSLTNCDEMGAVEIDEKQNEVKYGDIFFTTSSETPDEVGMSSVWLHTLKNIYLNSFCFGFRPSKKVHPYYMAFMLRSPCVRAKIQLLAQGISRYNISKTKLMETEIQMPSLVEQTSIGNFFHNLDGHITAQQTKLDNLKKLKSAYLKKMFV